MKLIDCHTHTQFSVDSEADLGMCAERADRLGLAAYAVTDHCECNSWYPAEHYSDGDDMHDSYRYKDCFLDSVAAVTALKEKYNGKLNLICGVEMGQPQAAPEAAAFINADERVDFIIGSDTLDAASYQELSSTEGITGVISDFDFVTEFIALNDEVAPLDDINIRKAIQMAIDKESIAQNIYSGLRTEADSVMPADMPYCEVDVTTPSYDMDAAIELMDKSGWTDTDGDGIREKDGKKLSFTITYPSTGVYDKVVLFFQDSMKKLGIEITTNPIDLMAFMQQVFTEGNYEITAYMSYWFPYDPYTFVANMYPSTDYTDASGIYSTDPQIAKALATMSEEEAKELIAGLYKTDDPDTVQNIFTTALNSANESSVVIPLNYRNEYAVFNNEVIESYTFNSIPNHVDVAAIKLK